MELLLVIGIILMAISFGLLVVIAFCYLGKIGPDNEDQQEESDRDI